ncbi:Uncharacterised protein [Candidatus Anstonella stagnisolia]|nr:Uncharacterised protein [Candidatus Anstonella stagnisolia]
MADQSLIDYIKKCKGLGRTDTQVRADLIKVGWDASDVDAAFFEMSPQARPPSAMSSTKAPAAQAAGRLDAEGQSAPKISPISMLPSAAKAPQQDTQQKISPQIPQQAQPLPQMQAQPDSSAQQQPAQQMQPTSLEQAAKMQQAASQAQSTQQKSPFPQPAQTQQLPAAGAPAKKPSPLDAIFSSFGKKQAKPMQPQSLSQQALQKQQPSQPQMQQQQVSQPQQSQQSGAPQTMAQQPKPQAAFGAGAKQPPIKILAAALFIVLILVGAYMYINATKPVQPLKPSVATNTSAAQNASAPSTSPTQPQTPSQNQTPPSSQPSTPPPPPPLPIANAATDSPSTSSPSPSTSLEQPSANASQNTSSSNKEINASSPPSNVLYPSELGLPPGVVQAPPVIPQSNSSSQNRTNSTNSTSQPAPVKNTTNQTASAPQPQITYPVRLWRTVGDQDNPRHFCYSIDKNYLRAYYYEYKGDYCNGDYTMLGFNWTFDQIDTCSNMPCCRYNSTSRLSRNYIYFQCDSD